MKKYSILFVCLVSLLFIGSYTASATSNSSDDVTGWLWSPSIGWISMSHDFTGSTEGDHHVKLTTSSANSDIKVFSGYAWAPNLGWLSFEPTDVNNCPADSFDLSSNGGVQEVDVPGYTTDRHCFPRVQVESSNLPASGKGKVSGWARFVSLKNTASGGWVHLSGLNHGTKGIANGRGVQFNFGNGAFSGYAWSPDAGWISFDALGPGATVGSLTLTLDANPQSGDPALMSSVQLIANVGGTATGDLTYEFDCDDSSGSLVDFTDNVAEASFVPSYTGSGTCAYTANATASVKVTRTPTSGPSVSNTAFQPVAVIIPPSSLDLKIKRTNMTSSVDTGITIRKGDSFILELVNTYPSCDETVISNPGTASPGNADHVFKSVYTSPSVNYKLDSWNSGTHDDGTGAMVNDFIEGTQRTITIPTTKTTSLPTGKYDIMISCNGGANTDSVTLNVSNSTIIER